MPKSRFHVCNKSCRLCTPLLVTSQHQWGLHTIREEQFNTTLLCREHSIHFQRVTPSGWLDQYLLLMTWAYNAVGSGELLFTVFELVLRNRSYIISDLFVSNSCLVVIQFTTTCSYALVLRSCMDRSSLYDIHDVYSYVFTLIRKNVSSDDVSVA